MRFFVENRGCIFEAEYCQELGGEWIIGPFPFEQQLLPKSKCRELPNYRWEPQPHEGGVCVVQYQSWPEPQTRFCHEFEVEGLRRDRALKAYTPSTESYHNCWFESRRSNNMYPTSFCRIDGQREEWLGRAVLFR